MLTNMTLQTFWRKLKKVKGKADDLYRGSMQFEDHRRTALQYPLIHWTLCRCQQYGAFSMKALSRYQIILLGEQRHIRCEQLAQSCCPNNVAVVVKTVTARSRVQRPTATPLSHPEDVPVPKNIAKQEDTTSEQKLTDKWQT